MTDPADKPPWLLVSDIDDTLTGAPAALEELGHILARNRPRIRFALNSSRPAASVDQTIADYFPASVQPDAIITALGTEIRLGGHSLVDWQQGFATWPRDAIFQTIASLGHQPHAPRFQSQYKVSFAIEGEKAQAEARAALAARNLPCTIIASGKSDFDLIPPAAGKDKAALYLADTIGIPRDRIIVAGDSGNDLAMFRIAAHAIAVGNARPELLETMPAATSWHATAFHAAGVLEGLRHFGILPPSRSP